MESNFTTLMDDIVNGRDNLFIEHVKNGELTLNKYKNGMTLLMFSLFKRNIKISNYLLDIDSTSKDVDDCGRNILSHAAYCGDVGIIKKIVEKYNDIYIEDNYERTPLDIASGCGNLEAVKFFTEEMGYYKDINKAMELAVSNSHLDVIKYLFKYDFYKSSCILNLSIMSHNMEIFKYLYDMRIFNDSDVCKIAVACNNIKVLRHLMPIMLNILVPNLYEIYSADDRDIFKIFVRYVTDMDSGRDDVFWKKIIKLAMQKKDDVSLRLALYNSSVKSKYMKQNAYEIDHLLPNEFHHLISEPVDLKVDIMRGKTGKVISMYECGNIDEHLFYSVKYGQLDIFKFLLEKGAKMENMHNYLAPPLECASEFGYIDILKYMLELLPNENLDKALLVATVNGRIEIMKFLLERGADPYHIVNFMHLSHNEKGFKFLIQNIYSKGFLEKKNDDGFSPLENALIYGKSRIVQLLLDYGVEMYRNGERFMTEYSTCGFLMLYAENTRTLPVYRDI